MMTNSKGTGFIKEVSGRPGVFCVFEDDGETGYLYVYEPEGRGILTHLHVYDRSPLVQPAETDIAVEWSTDKSKCGVRIWNKMRGVIDLGGNREGRVWVEGRDSPGIDDREWLAGFESN